MLPDDTGPGATNERLEITVATRLGLRRSRTLDLWCARTLRKRSELVGLLLNRMIELYEQDGRDEPLETFVSRLTLSDRRYRCEADGTQEAQ